MRLAVCILHYGKNALTANLHGQFLKADPASCGDIFVLDNASPEPYEAAWKRLDENMYWGGAFEWAVNAFEAEGYTHVWFCNNDITFVSSAPYYQRALTRIAWLEKNGRVGVYSPSATSNPYHPQMITRPGEQCAKTMYVDGIAPVVSLACVRAMGGLDLGENPYGYGVDIWLSYRAAREGWGVWVDHTLVLRHKYHATAKEQPGFLAIAADAENRYMSERFGPKWREIVTAMQTMQERIQ
ncbi:MAG: hypothetical protein DELT_00433 [Desulfovibrio sp.]